MLYIYIWYLRSNLTGLLKVAIAKQITFAEKCKRKEPSEIIIATYYIISNRVSWWGNNT